MADPSQKWHLANDLIVLHAARLTISHYRRHRPLIYAGMATDFEGRIIVSFPSTMVADESSPLLPEHGTASKHGPADKDEPKSSTSPLVGIAVALLGEQLNRRER